MSSQDGSRPELEGEFEEFSECLPDDDEVRGVPFLFPDVPSDEAQFDGIIDSDIEDIDDDDDHDDAEVATNLAPEPDTDVQSFKARDGTVWTTQVPPLNRRTPSSNFVEHDSRPKYIVQDDATMEDVFRMIFPDSMLDSIVEHTNAWGRLVVSEHNAQEGVTQHEWKDLDRDELSAFIGLQIWLGMERNSKCPIDSLWSKDPLDRRPIFPATMGRDRFKTLTRMLRFDDALARRIRLAQDPASVERDEPVRELMEVFNYNIKAIFEPGMHLTVDETLIPFRGRAPFRVYMRNKPAKYGLKFWNIADSKTAYILGLQLYTGKPPGASREFNQGHRVVIDMTRPYVGTNRGVTTDNFFTSLKLAMDLKRDGLTLLGTIRKTRREVPVPLREKRGREEYSSIFVFKDNATLVSYKPRGLKEVVLVLSTEHHDCRVDENEAKKPDMILAYNSTKGGVDTADQMISEYTSQRQTRRWPMKLWYALIDMAAMNSFKIYSMLPHDNSVSRMATMRELALDLMWKHHERRSMQTNQKHVRDALNAVAESRKKVLPLPVLPIVPPRLYPDAPASSRRRCELHAGPAWRRPVSRTTCMRCHRFVCAEHKVTCCVDCSPPLQPVPELNEIDD